MSGGWVGGFGGGGREIVSWMDLFQSREMSLSRLGTLNSDFFMYYSKFETCKVELARKEGKVNMLPLLFYTVT
jgi:hypothetical protein